MRVLVLACVVAVSSSLPFTILPLPLLRQGAQAFDFVGTMSGLGSINGTMWIAPEYDESGVLLRVRTTQVETFGANNSTVTFLGVSDQATSHYLQGELPASSPSQGCSGLGCSAFDEVVNCTAWQFSVFGASCNCTVKRVCGAGAGLTGWFTSNITLDGTNVVASNSEFSVEQSVGFLYMIMKQREFGSPPSNPCF